MAVVILFISVCFVPTVSAATVAPKKITLSKTFKTVYIGQNYKLKVTAVTPKKADKTVIWKTSNPKIATVDKNGVVKGKKKGTVTITATSTKNKRIKATCKINVRKFKEIAVNSKSRFYSSLGCSIMEGLNFADDSKREDFLIIRNYAQLKNLKNRIKTYYDIKYYYNPNSIWYLDDEYAEEESVQGDDIIKILDGYNKNFFKNNILYYNCQTFTNLNVKGMAEYSYKCTNVTKKILNGKLTCVIEIQRKFKRIITPLERSNCNTVTCFITLNKKDMSGVQVYKPRYYEYLDFEHVDDVHYLGGWTDDSGWD